jgi:membrane protease YdiL (CAAX protease family)
MTRIFRGPDGLRSGWRAAFSFVAIFLATILGGIAGFAFLFFTGNADALAALRQIDSTPAATAFALFATKPFELVAAFGATWLFARFVDRTSLAGAGLGGPPLCAARGAAVGTLIGAALILLALGFAAFISSVAVTYAAPSIPLLAELGAGFVFAAAVEELLFRGYPFQWAVRAMGFHPATAVFAILFAVAHLRNNQMSALAFVQIAAASVLLSYARSVGDSLWLPIGVHFGWNAAQGLLLGIAVSGNSNMPSIAHTAMAGPAWATGGDFGLEGSIGGLAACAVGIAVLGGWRARRSRGGGAGGGPGTLESRGGPDA